jgi:hypothetical protein
MTNNEKIIKKMKRKTKERKCKGKARKGKDTQIQEK